MSELFKAVGQASKGASFGLDSEGRAIAGYLAVVSANEDPLNLRRIKVVDPVAPGLESDWVRRLLPFPGYDPPLPAIDSTVMVWSVDGVVTNGWYFQCNNLTAPPLAKSSPVDDLRSYVAGEQSERTDQGRIIDVGQSLTLRTDSGSSIVLAADGSIALTDASGNSMRLDGAIIMDTSSLTVEGKEITTVGAADDRGHQLVSRGW